MPGLIAIAGQHSCVWERLYSEFVSIWQPLESYADKRIRMATHAHRGGALIRDVHGSYVAVDGEAGIYRPRKELDLETSNYFAYISDGFLKIGPECKGNLLVANAANDQLHFASEWTGTFPLYYLELDGCLVVSSHLRPLARATGVAHDMTGIFEYLRFSYNIAGRTLFERVRRVLAGQAFRYNIYSGQLECCERSRLWTGMSLEPDPAETTWTLLKAGVRRSFGNAGPPGIMLSGGWDSRTLLAAIRDELGIDRLLGYSHGDIQSRELRLVTQLAKTAGIDCRLEAIDDTAYDLEALKIGFTRVENVVFPHWHRAGVLLCNMGAATATAGVFGEILGGHYGPAMRLQGVGKILAVGLGLIGIQQGAAAMSSEQLAAEGTKLLQLNSLSKPWTVRTDAWEGALDLRHRINADINEAMMRLIRRGIKSLDQLMEAFITEHRGTQYINMQLLSCRGFLDVALPFADQASLAHACDLPLTKKLHNRVNQDVLRRHAPSLLDYPMAATLLKASQPIAMQEGSRLLRRVAEDIHWRLHFSTKKRVPPPKLGWVNFEFLRDGKSLGGIVNHLSEDIWDREAIERHIHARRLQDHQGSLHPISDALMKVFTIQLMLQ